MLHKYKHKSFWYEHQIKFVFKIVIHPVIDNLHLPLLQNLNHVQTCNMDFIHFLCFYFYVLANSFCWILSLVCWRTCLLQTHGASSKLVFTGDALKCLHKIQKHKTLWTISLFPNQKGIKEIYFICWPFLSTIDIAIYCTACYTKWGNYQYRPDS